MHSPALSGAGAGGRILIERRAKKASIRPDEMGQKHSAKDNTQKFKLQRNLILILIMTSPFPYSINEEVGYRYQAGTLAKCHA